MAAGRSTLSASFKDALRAVAAALDALAGNGMVIGGVAVIARGVARATHPRTMEDRE